MKFGLFYQIQVPKPWDDESTAKRIWEALDQIVYAEEMGLDMVKFMNTILHRYNIRDIVFNHR